jgi:hypothetical protein
MGSSLSRPTEANKPKFPDESRQLMRLRHYSRRTEEAYIGWIRRYILFHGKRHPRDLGESDIAKFLSSLAVEGRVAASTQNQALNAIKMSIFNTFTSPCASRKEAGNARRCCQ